MGRRPRNPTPARACPDRPERVNHIATMMATLKWERGKSVRDLAALWGLSESTIRDESAEASRRVTASEEEVRLDITTLGTDLMKSAHREKDRRGFAAVGKLLADVTGANAATRSKVEIAYETVDIEQLRGLLRPLGWDIVPLAIDTQGETAGEEPAEGMKP